MKGWVEEQSTRESFWILWEKKDMSFFKRCHVLCIVTYTFSMFLWLFQNLKNTIVFETSFVILFEPGWEISNIVIIAAQRGVIVYQSLGRILRVQFSKEGAKEHGWRKKEGFWYSLFLKVHLEKKNFTYLALIRGGYHILYNKSLIC